MSERRLFNAIRRIALLQMLSRNKFITSKKIRSQFTLEYELSFYDWIDTFQELGWVEVLEKDGDFAGDDRREYKLTLEGEKIRERLLKELLQLLEPVLTQIVKKKVAAIQEPLIEGKEEQIDNFIMEFSGECEGMVDNNTLQELQKILKRLLSKML